MKISKFIAVALSAIVFVQAPVVAFADEYTDTADLYKLGAGDYLFASNTAGFYLTDDTNVKNGDNPYPGTGEGTLISGDITGGNGIDYGAGHAFDCQWDPGTYKSATGLADPYINRSHQALGENECVNLKYNGTNYTLTLTAKGSGATPGSEIMPTPTTTPDPAPSSDPDPAPATDENQPQETPTPEPEQQESAPAPEPVYQPVEQPQEPEAPAPVAINVVTTAVGNALPTTELGNATVPTKTVALDLYTITPAQLVSVVSDTVVNAPSGGNVVIETNAEACLDKNMIQAFTQRPDVAINIVFKNKLGQKLRVTIPAGYPVTTLLDANGYCGYMHLVDIFGAIILSE